MFFIMVVVHSFNIISTRTNHETHNQSNSIKEPVANGTYVSIKSKLT
jgi:hypothetical protein